MNGCCSTEILRFERKKKSVLFVFLEHVIATWFFFFCPPSLIVCPTLSRDWKFCSFVFDFFFFFFPNFFFFTLDSVQDDQVQSIQHGDAHFSVSSRCLDDSFGCGGG